MEAERNKVSNMLKLCLLFLNEGEVQILCLFFKLFLSSEIKHKSTILGTYCSGAPIIITSTFNIVYIKFRSDFSFAGRGFQLTYSTLCKNEVRNTSKIIQIIIHLCFIFKVSGFSGVIESPNFPLPYPHDRNCSWTISAPRGSKVNITFSNFELEDHARSGNCSYDYLKISERSSTSMNEEDQSLGRFCGTEVPSKISSALDRVTVDFVSDINVSHNGFRLEWIVDGCGGKLSKPSGTFSTPNYPQNYPSGIECIWSIEVEFGSKIELNITDFQLEAHDSCEFDFLAVHGGADESSTQLLKLCDSHTTNTVVTSFGNKMFVKFSSDQSRSSKGFIASYATRPGGCGGFLRGKQGVILSPNYPNNYDPHDDCGWLIEVDQNHVVKLTFEDFDVEPHQNCSFDHVAVYDGNSTDSPLLLLHCGQNLPDPSVISSSGNQMYLRLKADDSISSKGFKANFTKGCGARIITDGEGELTSPGYPGFWAENGNCSWIIQGFQETDRVTLHITYMDLDQPENFGNCSDEVGNLEVRDGDDNEAPLIGRYCGMTIPPSITSQGSTMYIHIRNNVWGRSILYSQHNTFQRFRAIYTVEDTACGGSISSTSGRFASPQFPNSYPLSVECIWTINAPAGNRVFLTFNQLDLEESENCNKDYVDVFIGSPDGEHVGRYCGTSLPAEIPPANKYWIKFNSDDSDVGRGFIAEFHTQYGGNLNGTSGEIESVDYPHVYLNMHDAVIPWTITVADGSIVEVSFLDFEMESYSENHCTNTLSVLDGLTIDSPVLYQGCGSMLPNTVRSSANTAIVVWSISSYAMFGSKFKLRWRETALSSRRLISTGNTSYCGGNIVLDPRGNRTFLASPGYPENYENNLNCDWVVQTSEDMRIKMTILYLSLGKQTH